MNRHVSPIQSEPADPKGGAAGTMNPAGLPRTVSYPVMIHRGEIRLRAMMVVVFSDSASTWMEAATKLLGETERHGGGRHSGDQRAFGYGENRFDQACGALVAVNFRVR